MRAVRPTPVVTGKAALLRALKHALDGEKEANEFLRMVLWDAHMQAVPEGRDAYEAFVREEVLPRLVPMVRLDKLHDLVRRTIGEEGSLHPPPLKVHGAVPGEQPAASRRARVVLVDADAFRRMGVSRELVRAGFDVEVVATPAEVLNVEAFHAVILPLDEEGERVARALASAGTRAGLVTYDDASHRAAVKRVIDAWPSDKVAIVGRDATPAALCSRVKIVIG